MAAFVVLGNVGRGAKAMKRASSKEAMSTAALRRTARVSPAEGVEGASAFEGGEALTALAAAASCCESGTFLGFCGDFAAGFGGDFADVFFAFDFAGDFAGDFACGFLSAVGVGVVLEDFVFGDARVRAGDVVRFCGFGELRVRAGEVARIAVFDSQT